jgi:hypothetical protein
VAAVEEIRGNPFASVVRLACADVRRGCLRTP